MGWREWLWKLSFYLSALTLRFGRGKRWGGVGLSGGVEISARRL